MGVPDVVRGKNPPARVVAILVDVVNVHAATFLAIITDNGDDQGV